MIFISNNQQFNGKYRVRIFGSVAAVILSAVLILILHYVGLKEGIVFLNLILFIPFFSYCLVSPKFGFFLAFTLSSFLFFIKRYFRTGGLPLGISIEVIFGLAILGIVIKEFNDYRGKKYNPSIIHILIAIWAVYNIVHIINPAGYLDGWFIGVRKELLMFEVAIVVTYAINSISDLKDYTRLWLFILLIASFYCFFQEFFGLTDREARWLASDEDRSKLLFQYGRLRLWSIFSDPTTFGIFCSYGVVFTLVLATSLKNTNKRVILVIFSVIFFLASAYTGTRTAYAIVPIGLVFYFSLTVNNPKTILLIGAVTLTLLIIIFGPFYGNVARRIRSAFFPSDDASYHVREVNRARIRPYLFSHPFGGGMGTTGEVGNAQAPYHPLAGFPPDSYYLKLGLEHGFIALLFHLSMQVILLLRGINYYYQTDNLQKKGFYLAYLSGFVTLSIAGYAQEAIVQFPNNLIFYSTFIIVEKIKDLPLSNT